jgi:PAS domain S-box-containing protein
MYESEFNAATSAATLSEQATPRDRHLSELELVYQNAPVGLCVVDPELRFVRVNDRLAEINGIPASEHIGRSVRDLLPALAPAIERTAAQVIATRKPLLNIELSGETPAEPGRTRYWNESWYPALDESGDIKAIGVVVDEITEAKEKERELAASEERFRLALSSGAVTVYEQDKELRYRWLYPTEPYSSEVIGMTDSQLAPGPGAEYLEHLKRSVIETGRSVRETIGIPVRKESRWYDVIIEPRYDAKGEVVGVGGTALDVTDRVKAEKANRESEALLQMATETALMFGWELDFGAGTAKWSSNASKIIGRPERELPKRAAEANFFVHPDDKKDMYEKYLDALQRGVDQYSVEYRGTNRSGEMRNWFSIGRIIRDDSGNGSRVIGVTQDITERKRVEDELRRKEMFNRQLIANSPDCLKTLDLQGNLLSMSPSGLELLELERIDSFIGRPYEGFWRESDREAVRMAIAEAAQGGSGRFQAFCPSAKGKPLWWDVIIRPIFGPDGRLEKLLSVSRDITDQKQAELDQAALYKVGELIRSATCPDDLLGDVVDLVGNYLEVSRCVFLELDPSTGTALAHRDFHLNGQPALAGSLPLGGFSPESIAMLRAGKTLVNNDVKNTPRTAEYYDPVYKALAMEAFVGVPLFHDGKWVAILAVVQDTPRKWAPRQIGFIESAAERTWLAVERLRSEAALKETLEEKDRLFHLEQEARAAAEDANRARDEFLAVLSHELRTPLHSMKGWLSMLRHDELDDVNRERAMEAIHRGVETQNALIEDLLDVSRIVSGRLQIEHGEVSLVQAVRNVVDQCRPAAEQKGVKLNLSVGTEDLIVAGDKVRLGQVAANLVENALKFTHAGGHVSVEVERVSEWAEVVISDTGEGIRSDSIRRIFERFEQQDSSSRRLHGGLGLGLSIARHLTELHGGTLNASSEGEGKGSKFTLRLPLLDAQEPLTERSEAPSVKDAPAEMLEGLRILLVEDDQEALEMLTIYLSMEGAQVSGCDDAAEALERLRTEQFDLMIADIGMPYMNGHDLIKAVREELGLDGQTLPAVALSGFAAKSDKEFSVACGFQAHLTKPLDPLDLISSIRKFV